VSGQTFNTITMCTQQKPATNSRKDRQRSALILNTGHSEHIAAQNANMKWYVIEIIV